MILGVKSFDLDDIDHVTALAYNYGITLCEVGQIKLAEQFLSKALSLLRFCSPSIQSWRDSMQVFAFHIRSFDCPFHCQILLVYNRFKLSILISKSLQETYAHVLKKASELNPTTCDLSITNLTSSLRKH
jgi:hypothetical protein